MESDPEVGIVDLGRQIMPACRQDLCSKMSSVQATRKGNTIFVRQSQILLADCLTYLNLKLEG